MKTPLEYIAPTPEELWERGGADMYEVEIDEGRHVDVPFFNLEVSLQEARHGDAVISEGGRDQRKVGEWQEFIAETSDGIDRTVRLYTPLDSHTESVHALLHADTAWMTTITGHNDWVASHMVHATGQPMIVVGAEHGTGRRPSLDEILRIPKTLGQAATISLAKSAQSSALITSELMEKSDLPRSVVKTGESRGAMLTPAHEPYSREYGYEIVYGDTTAPCVPEQLFKESEDIKRLAKWPISEAFGAVALGLPLIARRELTRQRGTVTFNPNFLLSNLVGVGPALFSGEAGRFASWWSHNTPLYISTFKNDLVSRPDVWRELFSNHNDVEIREHKGGTHMTLAHPEVVISKTTRMVQALHRQRIASFALVEGKKQTVPSVAPNTRIATA